MHRILQDFEENDHQVLDRLVDGELTELERKELLSALDDEPAGWRRCALAFLEAQSWESDLQAFRDEPAEPVTRSPSLTRAWRYLPLGLAMAASLLLAFFGGIALQGGFSSRGTSDQLAQQNTADESIARRDQIQPSQVASATSQSPIWKTVKIDTGDGQQVEYSAVDGSKHDVWGLLDSGSAIPSDVLAQLEERGYRVEREKQLWPSQLEDGTRLIVPVEQVQVHYVGNSAYQ